MDLPILVQTADRRWNKLDLKKLKRVAGVGPVGWATAASELLNGGFQKK